MGVKLHNYKGITQGVGAPPHKPVECGTSLMPSMTRTARTVRRRVWTITDLTALPELTKWPDLQAVIAVETIRMAHQHAPVTSDYRFYISSLARSATAFVAMIRQHWDIENKLHWSLDVTFNEDRSRIRKEHAAENMAAVRHVALNLLCQEHSHQISLRQKRLLCSLDKHYLLRVLSRAT